MYYTNSIKVTLKDTESAIKALEILRNRLDAGFEADKIYKGIPSQNMREALEVVENTIVLSEDFGYYVTEDAESVMFELIQNLAENMGNESFVWDGCDSNDYTDGWFNAEYENGLLNIKYTYFPYLIDTRNGNDQIVSSNSDIAAHYGDAWLEKILYGWKMFSEDLQEDKIVVMTYAKFGVLAKKHTV